VLESAPVRRRLLGEALRRYRLNLGFGLDEAAEVLECDRSKISRIETGQRGIKPKELRELLTEYGVAEPEKHALEAIAATARRGAWWEEYAHVLAEQPREFAALEGAAAEILVYDAQRVPELLQTTAYARAALNADLALRADQERGMLADLRLARQRVILGDRQTRLVAVIGEGALREVVGSSQIARGQLRHLADISASSHVTVRVLPSGSGTPACGSATILRFRGGVKPRRGIPAGPVRRGLPGRAGRRRGLCTGVRAAEGDGIEPGRVGAADSQARDGIGTAESAGLADALVNLGLRLDAAGRYQDAVQAA
jgi:transcriptional regulator with XRE-family HTH domain